jgi:hypothetical protein
MLDPMDRVSHYPDPRQNQPLPTLQLEIGDINTSPRSNLNIPSPNAGGSNMVRLFTE